jgi:esterase/lipase superfamily enzyme
MTMKRARRPAGLLLLLTFSLAGCAGRPGAEVLQTVAASKDVAGEVTVYAATTRKRDGRGENTFGNGRTSETAFASFDISLPKNHAKGKIEWPERAPDIMSSFAVTRQKALTSREFEQLILRPSSKSMTVFVHGYNYNFQESLFRLAQMTSDAGSERLAVLFAWPSVASVSGYVADRDSATFSRDNLASLLEIASRRNRGHEVVVFAHSMGSWLTMEALRTLQLQGKENVLKKLAVVLAAPDIDADVFATQARQLKGRLARPLTILVSEDDRALRVASRLGNGEPRIGALSVSDHETRLTARENGVAFVDISSLDAPNALNHDRYIDLTTRIPQFKLRAMVEPAFVAAGTFTINGASDPQKSVMTAVGSPPIR